MNTSWPTSLHLRGVLAWESIFSTTAWISTAGAHGPASSPHLTCPACVRAAQFLITQQPFLCAQVWNWAPEEHAWELWWSTEIFEPAQALHPVQPCWLNAMRAAASRCCSRWRTRSRLRVRAANACYKTHKVLRTKQQPLPKQLPLLRPRTVCSTEDWQL